MYLVGTPIGNLEDISLRALRVLREADRVACEDTRQTHKLLHHFGIKTPRISYHEFNERTASADLARRLRQGERIALVSDAGLPGVSDPGYRLVQLAIRQGTPVVPVPGASAVTAALVASGLPPLPFCFRGFLPPKRKQRQEALRKLAGAAETAVFFESPRRIVEALEDVLEVLGDRPTVVAREMTKLHEEFLRGRCSEVLETLRARPAVRGEVTLLLGSDSGEPAAEPRQPLPQRVEELMRDGKLSRMEALKTVARERGISKSQAYREYQAGKNTTAEA